jgi:predicted glutamine amidotransferase
MCKLAIFTAHDKSRLRETVLATWRTMAGTEKDGFGACWLSPAGRIVSVHSSTPSEREELPDFVEGFWQGEFSPSNGGPLMIHGRTATCSVELENTHPIVINNQALVHNGIVDSDVYFNAETTCDSELLLHAWKDNGIKALEADIDGYYAFGLITTHRKGYTLDIVKDDRAALIAGKNESGYVFATTDSVLAATGAKRCGVVKNNVWIQYKGKQLVKTVRFTPKKVIYQKSSQATIERSLGPSYSAPNQATVWRTQSQEDFEL